MADSQSKSAITGANLISKLTLAPAAELAAKTSKPYSNDSAEYRQARAALLAEEIELRRHSGSIRMDGSRSRAPGRLFAGHAQRGIALRLASVSHRQLRHDGVCRIDRR